MPTVILERPLEHIALVRLNRPEVKNALNAELRDLLAEHFQQLGDDPTVRCIVLTGNSDAFAAGADLKEIADADVSLDTGLMLERKAFELLFASQDQKEGMRAFIEKRKPVFEGR